MDGFIEKADDHKYIEKTLSFQLLAVIYKSQWARSLAYSIK